MTLKPSLRPARSRERVEASLDARFRHVDSDHPLYVALRTYCRDHFLRESIRRPEILDDAPEQTPDSSPIKPRPGSIQLDELLAKKSNLITMPHVVAELQELVQDNQASAAAIGAVIGKDPKLTASALRLANSPLYRPEQPVDTVSRAVAMLGVRQISSLALGASLIANFSHIPFDQSVLDRFWCHSVACALAARGLAEMLDLEEPERYFVGGLLHDIGRLFFLGTIQDVVDAAALNTQHSGATTREEETRLVGFSHCEAGAVLLRRWHFGEKLVAGVEMHHDPGGADIPDDPKIIHLADILAKTIGMHCAGDYAVPQVDESVWKRFGLHEDKLRALLDDVVRDTDKMVDVLVR